MQRLSLLAALTIGTAAIAVAPGARAQATATQCSVYTCMAGIAGYGASGGPACQPYTSIFFDQLVVYDEEGFDAEATAALRQMYFNSCAGTQLPANMAIARTIVAEYFGTP